MNKEVNEKAPYFGLPNGLSKEVDYLQKFVRAPHQGAYPCNEAAKKCSPHDEAMRISMGK